MLYILFAAVAAAATAAVKWHRPYNFPIVKIRRRRRQNGVFLYILNDQKGVRAYRHTDTRVDANRPALYSNSMASLFDFLYWPPPVPKKFTTPT